MSSQTKKWIFRFVKICIAILGLWLVTRMVEWHDTAELKPGTVIRNITFPESVKIIIKSPYVEGGGGKEHTLPDIVQISFGDQQVRMIAETSEGPIIFEGLVVEDTRIPATSQFLGLPNKIAVPRGYLAEDPRGEIVHVGLKTLLGIARERWWFLAAAWAILLIPFCITAIRWRNLLWAQNIHLPIKKCLELTFVGQFYSILLPGITGGDLVKIVYTARLTGSKTKSIITIVLDRVIGLIALIVIGGIAAGVQMVLNARDGLPPNPTLRNVLILIVAMLLSMTLFAMVYFSIRLRKLLGLQKLIDHPKVPEFIKKADDVLHTYRHHRGLLFWGFFISLISQIMPPVSAWLAGKAFGMDDVSLGYYMAYVPVALLAASLPISPPQGFGVLDWVIYHFFVERGLAKASQAFALTQAIRFLPLLWNSMAAYWVITGSYSRKKMAKESDSFVDGDKPIEGPIEIGEPLEEERS